MFVRCGQARQATSFDLSFKGANYYRNSRREERKENCRNWTTTSASLVSTVFSCGQLIACDDGCGGNIDSHMACQIHQLIAVIATDIGGSGLSDGGGCHIHLNLRSASHKLNVLAGGHPSSQAARGALQEELLSQTRKGAHNRIGVQFLCGPETESVNVRI